MRHLLSPFGLLALRSLPGYVTQAALWALHTGSLLFSLLPSEDKNKIPLISFTRTLTLAQLFESHLCSSSLSGYFSKETSPFQAVSIPTLTPTNISQCCTQPPPIRSKQAWSPILPLLLPHGGALGKSLQLSASLCPNL